MSLHAAPAKTPSCSRKRRGISVAFLLAIALCFPILARAEDRTSLNTPYLKDALEKYPDADANHDGILTEQEAIDYHEKMLEKKQEARKVVAPAPTFENVSYGPYERNALDFWKANSASPAPVLVCIHGGGFRGGDKTAYRSNRIVNECLARGISVAAINYRYTTTAPFPAPMLDGARALQFLRSKAKEWNIDPARIGGTGESAGGDMLVWLGCHADFAEPGSADEIARQSTKLSFVCGQGAQTFNDPEMIHRFIYSGAQMDQVGFEFYGIKDPAEFQSERIKKLGYEASAINFVTKDAPPFFLTYNARQKVSDAPYPEGTPFGIYIHCPKFGELFKDKCDACGVECEFHYSDNPEKPGDQLAFILGHFGMK
jgi:acetyl esterase